MKIVIAAGLYPPDLGGPSLYAKGVHEALEKMGHSAPVVRFSEYKRYPSGLRHILYAARLMRHARGADAIFAFDTVSAGIPAAWVGSILRVPVVVRVGGDYLWEQYVERTKKRIPLPALYASRAALDLKSRITRFFVGSMVRRAYLAFNTRWLLDTWHNAYDFPLEKASVVGNVIPVRRAALPSDNTILVYGRPLALKNADSFRRAVEKAGTALHLEEGTLPHEEFLKRIASSHAVAVPSISDVAPNALIDAITGGKPFIITKHSGYAEEFKDFGVVVDPLSEEDMARGVRELADPATYRALCEKIAAYQSVRTYDDVAKEMLALLPR